MLNPVEHDDFLEIKRRNPLQAGRIDAVLVRIGAPLVMRVDAAYRAEIMFCRARK